MKHVAHALPRLLILSTVLATAAGCETGKGTGALIGTGMGALVGRAAGGGKGMLIGAGVGAMGGYIIGNEADRSYAREQQRRGRPNPSDLQPLMGTTWILNSITPESARPPHASVVIDFRPDGILRTTRTDNDGRIATDQEFYRVASNTLIVNDPDYIINGPFILQGQTLTFVVGKVTSRWTRIGS